MMAVIERVQGPPCAALAWCRSFWREVVGTHGSCTAACWVPLRAYCSDRWWQQIAVLVAPSFLWMPLHVRSCDVAAPFMGSGTNHTAMSVLTPAAGTPAWG
jgi:hypothetical protein